MVPHTLEPCCAGISNINFLIADVIQFVSGTIITFSKGGAAKIKSEQFSEFGSRTDMTDLRIQQTNKN